jgi:hypothetical protein
MNDTERLTVYQKAVANLIEFLYHGFGATWEQIRADLRDAGMSEEDIQLYNIEGEENPYV